VNVAGTWDQERQRTDEFREEQLDWLHQQNEQLARQTELLERIAKHTTLFYVLTIIWLVVGGLWFLTFLVESAGH
jgi:hypothetical protein